MFTGDDGHVTTIAVDPSWHRAKIGSRLLVELAKEARRRGARNLTLEVRVSNTGAQAMYEQFGFAHAGIRKNYYVETNEDALVMWAEHIDEPPFEERLAAIEAAIPGSTVIGEGMTSS
jgi:ribosomal-protein-alanine N-acetyltransferase